MSTAQGFASGAIVGSLIVISLSYFGIVIGDDKSTRGFSFMWMAIMFGIFAWAS